MIHYAELSLNINPKADELNFYIPITLRFVNSPKDLPSIIHQLKTDLPEYKTYFIYTITLARFGKEVLGGYHIFQTIQSSVLIGVLYSVVLTKLISRYVQPKKVYLYTCIFLFCTPIVSYSYMVLRDGAITFLYLIGIYLILRPTKLTIGLPIYVVIIDLLYALRYEHAMFMCSLVCLYVYLHVYKKKILSLFLILIALIFGYSAIVGSIDTMQETVSVYDEYTMSHANSSGFAMRILSLPSPIKEFACSILSQMFPIPPWAGMQVSRNVFTTVLGAVMFVRVVVWFYIVFSCCYLFLKLHQIHILGKPLSILVLLSIALIAVCSSEYYEARRIMCMYPAIYISFIKLRQSANAKTIFNLNNTFGFMYGGILLIYVLLIYR